VGVPSGNPARPGVNSQTNQEPAPFNSYSHPLFLSRFVDRNRTVKNQLFCSVSPYYLPRASFPSALRFRCTFLSSFILLLHFSSDISPSFLSFGYSRYVCDRLCDLRFFFLLLFYNHHPGIAYRTAAI